MSKVAAGYPEEYAKYAKMLRIGMPEVSVRNKLRLDGYTDDIFDKYLNPETAQNEPIPEEKPVENETNTDEKEAILENGGIDPSEIINNNGITNNNESNNNNNNININNNNDNNNNNNNIDNRVKGELESSQFVPEANKELKMDTLQAVPIKKTLLIVNTFIVNTAAFLNKFVSNCENKLHKIHTDIQRMETSLKILETKLSSIDWLRSAQQGNVPNLPSIKDLQDTEFKDDIKTNTNNIPNGPNGHTNNDNNNNNNQNGNAPPVPSAPEENAPPPEPEEPAEDPMLSDPDLIPWFKRLRFGVPEVSIRNKMGLAGFDEDTVNKVIALHKAR